MDPGDRVIDAQGRELTVLCFAGATTVHFGEIPFEPAECSTLTVQAEAAGPGGDGGAHERVGDLGVSLAEDAGAGGAAVVTVGAHVAEGSLVAGDAHTPIGAVGECAVARARAVAAAEDDRAVAAS